MKQLNQSAMWKLASASLALALLSASNLAAADSACLAKPPGLLGTAQSFWGTPIGLKVKGSYAYVGDWGRYTWGVLQAFDVSDPCNPVRKGIGETVIPGRNEIGDLALAGNLAYLANDANGVTVYDVSNPNVTFLPLVGRRSDATYAHTIFYDGARYLYVGNLQSPGRSLLVYDTTAFPAQPPAVYSAYLNRDVISVHVRGNRAYLFTSDGSTFHGLEILDITNPMAPSRISILLLPPAQFGDTGEVRVNGGYLYMAQKNSPQAPGGLRVVSIANELAPQVVGRFDIADTGSMDWKGPGLEVVGNTVYLCTKAGLNVMDVSDPAHPALVRTFPIPAVFGNALAAHVETHGPLAYVTIYNLDLPAQKGGLAIYKLTEAGMIDPNLSLISQTGGREVGGACAPGQIYRVNATWRNNGMPLTNVYAKATILTNGVLVTNTIDQTADGVIATGERFTGQFRIQLAACSGFQFKVSLFGFPAGMGQLSTGGLHPRNRSGNRVPSAMEEGHLGDFEFDLTEEALN